MSGISLITPTGGRPDSLARCRNYIGRFLNLIHGDVQWVIVDDCGYDLPDGIARTRSDGSQISMVYIRPDHRWDPITQINTLNLNLLAAIPYVKYDKVLIIEDDEWYSPSYAYAMCNALESGEVVGETPSNYYHVPGRRYRNMENSCHASLCQTAMRKTVLPILKSVCETGSSFIDVRFWHECTKLGLFKHFLRTRNCIGMKGLPGRPGTGMGHRLNGGFNWRPDSDLSVLRSWIGNDVQLYYPQA